MRFLAHFASALDLEVFRRHELAAVCETLRIQGWMVDPAETPSQPEDLEIVPEGGGKVFEFKERQPMYLAFIHLPTVEAALAVAARCMLLKCFYICYAEASSVDGLLDAADAVIEEESNTPAVFSGAALPPLPTTPLAHPAASLIHAQQTSECGSEWQPRLTPLLGPTVGHRYTVDTICRGITVPERERIIQRLTERIGKDASVEVPAPTKCEFTVILVHRYSTLEPPKGMAWPLLRAYLCVPVAKSGRLQMLDTYSLKKRPYIGTTSMPPELTFLMSNLGRVVPGSACYDPFCGTGSLLVSCAHFGGFTMGSDMDGCAMRGGTDKFKRSQQILHQQKLAMKHHLPQCLASNGGTLTDEEVAHPDMVANFKVYGLPHPDRIRLNFSLWFKCYAGTQGERLESSEAVAVPPPRAPFQLDCIVSDPPYGVREQKKRIATPTDTAETPAVSSSSSKPGSHKVANEEAYDISIMVTELLLFAGIHLRVGGRLVFWLPTTYLYTPDEIPVHPYLRLVLAEVQNLTLKMGRVLVVMERVEEPQCFEDRSTPKSIYDVTRALIKPRTATSSLRDLLGASTLEDNDAFNGYKRRRNEKVDRIRAFWRTEDEKRVAAEEGVDEEGRPLTGEELYKKYKKKTPVTAASIVANRIRKEEEKRLPHQQSHNPNPTPPTD